MFAAKPISDERLAEINRDVAEAHKAKKYRPVAVAAIERENGTFLFVQSAKSGNDWGLPQGGIDEGEDVAEALFRELEEELGLSKAEVALLAYCGVDQIDAPQGRTEREHFAHGKRYYYFYLRFRGSSTGLRLSREELRAYTWATPFRAQELLATLRHEKRKSLLGALWECIAA